MPKVISKGCITNRDQGGGNSKCGLGKTIGFRFRSNRLPNTKTTLTKCKDKTHTFEEDSINLRIAVKLWLSNKRLAIIIYGHISRWDVSKVKNFSYLFANKKQIDDCFASDCVLPDITVPFQQYLGDTTDFDEDLSCWNVSNAITMEGMFAGASLFDQSLNDWDVSNVTDMESMFDTAKKFNQPLNKWDVSKVTDMDYMFYEATNFNQPLNNWNVSKVADMWEMFAGASLFNQPLNNWNVSKVKYMSFMFDGATNFNQPLNNWNVGNVEDMTSMFKNAKKFNQPLNAWNVGKVTGMNFMFYNAVKFNQNLRMWCLNFGNTAPTDFETGSGITNDKLPIWNCPN